MVFALSLAYALSFAEYSPNAVIWSKISIFASELSSRLQNERGGELTYLDSKKGASGIALKLKISSVTGIVCYWTFQLISTTLLFRRFMTMSTRLTSIPISYLEIYRDKIRGSIRRWKLKESIEKVSGCRMPLEDLGNLAFWKERMINCYCFALGWGAVFQIVTYFFWAILRNYWCKAQ